MCGIGGILRVHPPGQTPLPPEAAIPEAWLDLIDGSIKHRGPDGRGRFRDRALRADGSVVDVAFVHRRLSIIDHAGGWQPMVQGGTALLSREGGPYQNVPCHPCPRCLELAKGVRATPDSDSALTAVVFNGCIYNHRDLRRELQGAGHVFATDHSDTEVFLHGWREWRHATFSRFDGMFACAIWDRCRAAVIFARDAFGEKPLYSLEEERPGPIGTFGFASTVPALLGLRGPLALGASCGPVDASPWVKFGWNQTTPLPLVREFTVGMARALPEQRNAECAEPEDEIYGGWSGDVLRPENRTLSADQADAALAESIASRLEADVPLGCFLSGGIDSALVTHYALRARSDITAFTVRMPHSAYDESTEAAATARVLSVKHEILDCDPRPAEDLVGAIEQLGLPFGDSSLLPSTWVSRAASRCVRVALSGDGGDELFLGYDRYRVVRHLSALARLPKSVLRGASVLVTAGADPKSGRTRFSRLLGAAAGAGYKELVAIFPPPHDLRLGLGEGSIGHFGMTMSGPGNADDAFMLARRFDLMFYLPGDLMRKTDTASMSVALEVRAPFLAQTVARLAIHASPDSLMPNHQRKGLLRAVARKYFPPEIVDRPKQGFAIPIGEWFRTDYGGMKTLLLDHLDSAEPWGPPSLGIDLNMKYVRQMLDEHLGSGPSGLVRRDHSQRLYMLLVLSIWARWLSRQ